MIEDYENCLHVDVYEVTHWVYRYKCKRCGERFVKLPKNDYFETNILKDKPKSD